MCVRILFAVLFLIPFQYEGYAQKADRTAQPSTSRQDSLIDIGISYHDKGKYDDAIKIFQKVLNENSSNLRALYEISLSCLAKQDYKGALKYSSMGAKYTSEHLPSFYMNMGNALINQKKHTEAIKVFEKAIKLVPNDDMLVYNLGLAYYNAHKLKSARKYIHKAIALNPNNPDSHIALALVYREMGKKVPAIFSLIRFLILEPNSERSLNALKELNATFAQLMPEKKSNSDIIKVPVIKDTDAIDGDMTVLETSLSINLGNMLKDEQAHEWGYYLRGCEMLTQIVHGLLEDKSYPGFCWKYYGAYLKEMQSQGHVETCIYYMYQSTKLRGVQSWLEANSDKAKNFILWNKSYSWPK